MEAYDKEKLVEKWEQSGLLEGALKKAELAQTLESSAAWIMSYVPKDDMKKVNTAASIVLPTVRRVLGDREFTFEFFVSHIFKNVMDKKSATTYKKEVEHIPWSEVLTDTPQLAEDLQLSACQKLETLFREKLNKYDNLVINGVTTDFKNDGFEIAFRCS